MPEVRRSFLSSLPPRASLIFSAHSMCMHGMIVNWERAYYNFLSRLRRFLLVGICEMHRWTTITRIITCKMGGASHQLSFFQPEQSVLASLFKLQVREPCLRTFLLLQLPSHFIVSLSLSRRLGPRSIGIYTPTAICNTVESLRACACGHISVRTHVFFATLYQE